MARAARRAIVASYRADAQVLAERYENLGPGASLGPFSVSLAQAPRGALRVLDLGAGTGAVTARLRSEGHQVWAVDPVRALWRQAPPGPIVDELPSLLRLGHGVRFDVALALGVWHHLSPPERRMAWRRLRGLIPPGGAVYLSLRLGPSPPGRTSYPARLNQEAAQARAQGFALRRAQAAPSVQPGNRALGVRWLWLWFERQC